MQRQVKNSFQMMRDLDDKLERVVEQVYSNKSEIDIVKDNVRAIRMLRMGVDRGGGEESGQRSGKN